jgi:hypothetical protein
VAKRFWLSFADAARAEGQRFLGACVVEVTEPMALAMRDELRERFPRHQPGAEWLAAAVRKTHQLGINPGGEVMTVELPDDLPEALTTVPRDRLLTPHELQVYGRKITDADDEV